MNYDTFFFDKNEPFLFPPTNGGPIIVTVIHIN